MRPNHRGFACLVSAVALAGGLLSLGARPSLAGSAWDEIRPTIFGKKTIEDGGDVLVFRAPYRAEDQRAVPIAVDTHFADGRRVNSITFIVDENPSPVAAIFRFADDREGAALGIRVRLNQASPARVIVEASDGRLYMAATFIKASGLGVCAAPPVSNQQDALQAVGEMRLTDAAGSDAKAGATRFVRRARLDIRHPQNTGMQMNQVTMLYIPLRFISAVEVRQGAAKIFDLDGSMTLSEDPRIEFDYRINGASHIKVRARDTSDGVWERSFPVGSGS